MVHKLLQLFGTFLKIGTFTFGGGYAMLALLENEFVSGKRWIDKDEFLNMTAIAESTPGPVAINSATYLGYRMAGVPGAVVATAAVCIPSFVIIYLISLVYDRFMEAPWVAYAFQGIRAGVVYLILSVGLKMLREMERNWLNLWIFAAVAAAVIACTLFSVSFSTIFCILISGAAGLCAGGLRRLRDGKGEA